MKAGELEPSALPANTPISFALRFQLNAARPVKPEPSVEVDAVQLLPLRARRIQSEEPLGTTTLARTVGEPFVKVATKNRRLEPSW